MINILASNEWRTKSADIYVTFSVKRGHIAHLQLVFSLERLPDPVALEHVHYIEQGSWELKVGRLKQGADLSQSDLRYGVRLELSDRDREVLVKRCEKIARVALENPSNKQIPYGFSFPRYFSKFDSNGRFVGSCLTCATFLLDLFAHMEPLELHPWELSEEDEEYQQKVHDSFDTPFSEHRYSAIDVLIGLATGLRTQNEVREPARVKEFWTKIDRVSRFSD